MQNNGKMRMKGPQKVQDRKNNQKGQQGQKQDVSYE